MAISPRWSSTVTRLTGLAPILSAKSVSEAPRRTRTTVEPSPRGTLTPPSDGACICSNSWRFARLDLRPRTGRPPPRPKAPWVPPRPPGPPRAPPGRPAKPPPPPGRPAKPPPPPAPGRPAPGRAGRSPGRPTAARSGIMPGLGRGAPGRGPPGPAAAGRGPPAPAAGPERPWGRGMPWLGAKGLLPGRALPPAASPSRPRRSPPRGMPWLGANGLLPGRGAPGRGAARPVSPPCPPSRAAGASGAGRAAGRGPGVGPSRRAAGAAGAWAAGAAGAAGAGAAGAAGPRARPVPQRQGRPARVRPVPAPARRRCRSSRRGSSRRRSDGCRSSRCGGSRRCRCGGASARLGRRLARLGLGPAGAELGGERLADLAYDGRLDGRACRPDELALFLQVVEQCLALDSELLGELVDPDLSHVSPVLWPGIEMMRGPSLVLGVAHR